METKLSLKVINDFFVSSVLCECLLESEIKMWGDHMLLTTDEYAEIYSELSMFSGPPYEVSDYVSMVDRKSWYNSEEELTALQGIACKRGLELYESSCEKALVMLEKHPRVEQLFHEVFPFIKIMGTP